MNLLVKDKCFYKKMAVIAIPISLQSMITIGVNMTDTTVSLICQREVLNLDDFQFSYFDMDLQEG